MNRLLALLDIALCHLFGHAPHRRLLGTIRRYEGEPLLPVWSETCTRPGCSLHLGTFAGHRSRPVPAHRWGWGGARPLHPYADLVRTAKATGYYGLEVETTYAA